MAVLIGFIMVTAVYYKLANEAQFIQDDAFTSLRYVENFVNGKGMVFNDGERVEGYTNFLWVMLLSAIKFLDLAFNFNLDLPFLAQFLSTLFGVPVLLIVYLLSKKILQSKTRESTAIVFSFSSVIMVLFTTPFIYWSVSGMETSLFILLTLLSIYYFLDFENPRHRNFFVLFSILNSFLRPEGLFFFLLLISFQMIKNYMAVNEFGFSIKLRNAFDKKILNAVIVYFLPIGVYLAFRLAYFGYPFPNTFYAKTDFRIEFLLRGWKYYTDFLEAYMVYGILYLPMLIQLIRFKTNAIENVLIGFCLIYTVMIIFIGGDVLPIYRFFLTVMPLLFILFINSTFELINEFIQGRFHSIVKYSLILILIAYSILNYNRNIPEMMEKRSYESGLVSKMKIYAEILNSVSEEEKIKSKITIKSKSKSIGKESGFTVAMSTIGAFSFYSGARIIDLVGLTDEYTAHNPKEVEGIDVHLPVLWKERIYNAGYVLSEKPDYVIFPAGAKPSAFAECALFVQEEFRKNYYMQLFYSKELNQLLPVFTRFENVRGDSADCGSAFVSHYIEANNLFLSMVKSGSKNLIPRINKELDAMLQKCTVRLPEVNTLKGMVFYHAKNFTTAENYLTYAAKADSTNAIARIYLKNIYFARGEKDKLEKVIREALKYSPYSIPGLAGNSLSVATGK